ncbi:MAG: ATP-binding protein [Bacteroidetes bacterium]|nr:ATP-binding protein [Bacteroidota bacterium]
MKRTLYQDLLKWKNSRRRKPLLLQGARQVGKTWLINSFGKEEYDDYVYLNFEQNPNLRTLFTATLSPKQIIQNISLYLGRKIVHPNTLICFDEIQSAPEAITSLKYFYEEAPEYHMIAAGSLLGVRVGKKTSFPVGKVNFMTLYPLSFVEYLEAIGESLLVKQLENTSVIEPLPKILHEKLLRLLKMYLYLGGMPEVLQDYLDHKDIEAARNIQNEILEAYLRDFSKYTDAAQAIKTSELWKSVPFQLAKENKKFKYSEVRKKARASTFEQTIEWLRNAGLIHLAHNIRTPKLPLSGYADFSKFKIYLLDTGLLGAMLDISSAMIIKPSALFSEYNGAFIENFVNNELIKSGIKDSFYWTSRSDAEVDFILQQDNEIFPIEVKSGTSRNTKSLRSYADKHNPLFMFRLSPRNFHRSNDFVNIQLYGTFTLPHLLAKLMDEVQEVK